jgi:hypothetical protein
MDTKIDLRPDDLWTPPAYTGPIVTRAWCLTFEEAKMQSTRSEARTDLLTVVGLSMLAYTLAVLLHEHLGHALACVLLGGRPVELGAFYVDCSLSAAPGLPMRLVALAGPLVSLATGALAFSLLGRGAKASPQLRYFAWLLGTIGLMTAAGYLLFSGIGGIGDFGTGTEGVLFGARPEWAYRLGLSVLGAAGYLWVILVSLRKMDALIGGGGRERVGRAQGLALTSYLTGGLTSVLIGLLNPHGLVIVLISSAASSLGGTSGLAWMMQLLDRKKAASVPPFALPRSWAWIAASLAVALLYALVLGPTIRP